MEMNLRNSLTSVLLIAAAAAPALAQEKAVLKSKKDAKPKEVTVLEENYKSVVVQLPGAGGKVPYLWKEIETLDYQNKPKELAAGIAAVKKGEFEEGIKLLAKFKGQQNLSGVFRQQALFYIAQAAESLSPPNLEEAIATYKQLLQEFKQSRYLQKANDRIVACLVASKKYDEAQKTLAATRNEAVNAKLDEELLREIDFLEASLLEMQNKPAEAANAFEKLSAAAASTPMIADLARVGAMRCQMQKGGDASKAKAVYEDVISKAGEATSHLVLAAAWNGLGEVQLLEGRKDRKPEKIQEALYSVLRGVVLYFPGENDRTSEYERSLFLSAQAFKALADLATDEGVKKLNQQRYGEKIQELKNRYPLSPLSKD